MFFAWQLLYFLSIWRPFWRKSGSVIFSNVRPRSESRRTHNHVLLSHLRLMYPYYIPQEQVSPVIPPDIRFPFRRLLQLARLAGILWRYSNLLPQGIKGLSPNCPKYIIPTRTTQKTISSAAAQFMLSSLFAEPLPNNGCCLVAYFAIASVCHTTYRTPKYICWHNNLAL